MDIFGIDVSARSDGKPVVKSVKKRPEPRKKITIGRMETDKSIHTGGLGSFEVPRRRSVETETMTETGPGSLVPAEDYMMGR